MSRVDVLLAESSQAKRRVVFNLKLESDHISPALAEAGGQPQISTNGSAFTNTGIGALVSIGFGRYYAYLTQAAVSGAAGDVILTRYKSANTDEAMGDTFQVVASTIDTVAQSVWRYLLSNDGFIWNNPASAGYRLMTLGVGRILASSYAGTVLGANKITLDDLAGLTEDGAFVGCLAVLFEGTGARQVKRIVAWDGTTATGTLDSNWNPVPDDTTWAMVLPRVDASSGARLVTLHTQTAGAVTIPGASITIRDAADTTTLAVVQTDVSGNAVVSLDDGSYKLRVVRSGYTFSSPVSLTVSADDTVNVEGTAVNVTPPSAPDKCVITGDLYDSSGEPLVGVSVTSVVVTSADGQFVSGKTMGNPTDPVTETTDENGHFEMEQTIGASVRFRAMAAGIDFTKTVPNAGSVNIADW